MPILGIWRGIEVSHNFARGEWDFTASSEGTLTWKAPDGTKTTAVMHGGDQSAVSAGIAITLTTEDGHPIGMVTATERKGIFLLDEKGNENIVNMVTLAFSAGEQPTDFGMAMKDSEFVLLACDDESPVCDFTKSKVAPSDLMNAQH